LSLAAGVGAQHERRGAVSYPPDFAKWPLERRNAYFAEAAARYGESKPRNREKVIALSSKRRDSDAEDKPTALVTEDSAALEFAELNEGKLLFDHDAGRWFEWTGAHWRRECTGLAFEWARQLVRKLSEGKKAGTRYALRKTSFPAGVERFARVDRTFAVTADHWDRDPFLLGTPGGTVELRTGTLRPADPKDAISRLTAVAPADAPDCPLFMAFLREATGDDDALIRFLQQFLGYCLCGSTREHALLFVHGGGGNGKTVLLNTVSWIMGAYAMASAMDAFVEVRGEKHTTDIAMLHGARLVTASEIAKGRTWNENLIKALTGGDPVTARFMRQDNFTFTPTFKLVVIGNHKPRLQSVNEATRRRFNIVPLDRTPANPDPQLDEKLRAEAPGILRWMIDGCLDWQESNGLVRPQSVLAATEEYFATQDLLGQWLEDECDVEPGNQWKSEKSGALFASWSDYAKRSGENPGSKVGFADELKQREMVPGKGTRGVRIYRGIRLKVPKGGASGE
jgi:putative DNA primase/helicase